MLGLADQVVSAGGNLLLLVVVASQTGADTFGAFALAYAVYLAALGVSRAINSEAMVVDRGRGDPPLKSEDAYSIAGGFLAGVAAGVLSAVAGVLLSSTTLVTLGLLLPVLLAQDAGRLALVARGRPGAALASDTVWTTLQVVALVGLIVRDVDGASSYLLAWGVPAAAAASLAMYLLHTAPRFRGIGRRYKRLLPLSSRFALEYLSGAGALQSVHLLIAGVLGVSAIGALRGAQTLLGPFNQLLAGLTIVLMPEMVRLRGKDPRLLTRVVGLVSVGGASCVVVGTLVIDHLPDAYGELLLGDSWSSASLVLLPAGLTIAANMAALGPLLGLRALGSATSSLRARVAGSLLTVVSALVPLAAGQSLLAIVWWMTLAVTLNAAIWWKAFHAAQREPVPERAREPATAGAAE